MPVAQRLFERCVQLVNARIGPFVKVAREQVFIFLDDLVDQRAVRAGDRLEIALAAVVIEQFDDILSVMRWQIEQHAFAAESFADFAHQPGQIDVVRVDLVDDDHSAEVTACGQTHHALGR